jgi:hypothetical protein
MNKTGERIIEKENQQKNIERLAAQKEMYFTAKRLFFAQFIVTVVITIALALAAVALSAFRSTTDLNWVRGSYGVMAAIVDLFLLNHFINQLRQRAAAIQELFDCDVLDLEWNNVCVGEKPKPEEIKKYADKHLKRVKSYDKLKTWYAETIKEVDGAAAKVICQRSNFAYDSTIRKSFLYWLVGIALAILVVVVVISLAINEQTRAVVSMSLFPILPILVFLGKLAKEHHGSLHNLESLKSSIVSLWSDVLKGTARDVDTTIRQIQDKIYQNRKSSPLIPEWFYDRKRPGLEEQMYYGVDDLVEQYRKATATK